jgi:hypothetical protein
MPDYFHNDDLGLNETKWAEYVFPDFICRYPWGSCRVDLQNAIDYARKTHGATQFVTVGFCWGAWATFQACADQQFKDVILGGASFHPSVHVVCDMSLKPNQETWAKQQNIDSDHKYDPLADFWANSPIRAARTAWDALSSVNLARDVTENATPMLLCPTGNEPLSYFDPQGEDWGAMR